MRLWFFGPSIVFLAIMVGCRSEDHISSISQPLISDQAHGHGTKGFWFLPPVVPRPQVEGTFLVGQTPTVRIDHLDGNFQPVRTLATYTSTTGPGSETVRETADPAYIVNWHTKEFSLDATHIYRIHVLLNNRSLGFADVQIFATKNEAKRADTNQYVPLLSDGTLPIKFWMNACAPVVCAVLDQCHVAGICEISTGTCSNPAAPDGTSCNDGDLCTQTDSCRSGACLGTNPVVCAASDQCHTAGTCNPSSGICSDPPVTDGTFCDDGDACTSHDRCQAGMCSGVASAPGPGPGILDINGDGNVDLAAGEGATPPDGAMWFAGLGTSLSSSPQQRIRAPAGPHWPGVVVNAGDLDRDGFDEVVFGHAESNRVYVHRGGAAGWLSVASQTIGLAERVGCTGAPQQPGKTCYGNAVAAGDINGDGANDLVIGSTGAVHVHLGRSGGFAPVESAKRENPRAGGVFQDAYGTTLTLGDLNRDGYLELIVGAFQSGAGAEGAVYVYQGSPSGIAQTPTTLLPPPGSRRFGLGLSAGQDLDQDGFGDLVVGAPFTSPGGALFVYRGSTAGVSTTASQVLLGQSGLIGHRIVSIGDFDGDGHPDIATADNEHSLFSHRINLYGGGPAGLRSAPMATIEIAFPGSETLQVAGLGDLNRDGRMDVAVAAAGAARVGVYHGTNVGGALQPAQVLTVPVPPGESRAGLGAVASWNPVAEPNPGCLVPPPACQGPGSIWRAGTMSRARAGHVAERLDSGNVLLAGGDDFSRAAELFDPNSGTVTPTGSLNDGRCYGCGAIKLDDGRVFVAGGWSGGPVLATAELYDPAIGSFSYTAGNMTTGRLGPAVLRLLDGRVLVYGGHNGFSPLGTAELYNPATQAFTAAGQNVEARLTSATLLLDGRVLMAAGQAPGGAHRSSAEIFDPATGTFALTGALSGGRHAHLQTRLLDGRVLVTGGLNATGAQTSAAEIYDPATGTFTLLPRMTSARGGHLGIVLPDGRVLILGGHDASGTTLASSEIFDPVVGAFTASSLLLDQPRGDASLTSLGGGRYLISGGYANGGRIAALAIFEPCPRRQ